MDFLGVVLKKRPCIYAGRIIRGTTLIYYFQHQSINRLGNNASVAHQSTCKAFADEFMGDLINKASYRFAPDTGSLKLYAYL